MQYTQTHTQVGYTSVSLTINDIRNNHMTQVQWLKWWFSNHSGRLPSVRDSPRWFKPVINLFELFIKKTKNKTVSNKSNLFVHQTTLVLLYVVVFVCFVLAVVFCGALYRHKTCIHSSCEIRLHCTKYSWCSNAGITDARHWIDLYCHMVQKACVVN